MRYGSLLLAASLGVCAAAPSAWGAGVFQESGGLVVVEVESAPVASPWASEISIGGYTGSAYYRATANAWSPGSGELVYTINITNAGTYRLRIRGHKKDVGDPGAHNDCYVKMVGQPGAEGTYNKVFMGGAAGVWQWDTTYDVDHNLYKPEYNLSAGQHEFRICARSMDYSIDRFILCNESMYNINTASDPSLPQSSTTPIANGTLQFGASTYSGPEGGPITVNVTRTGGSDGSVSVNYQTQNISATAGSDYSARSGTLTWNDGDASSKPVTIPLLDDDALEGSETFRVTLSNATGGAAIGSRSQATLTIVDNESAGVLSFTSATATVGEANGSITIAVRRTGDSDGAITVRYDTSNVSAVSGSDYTAVSSGTLSWADGDAANKTFPVSILNNTTLEGDETFRVTLRDPTSGVTLGSPSTITVTIIDDDQPGEIAFDLVSYSDPAENDGTVTLWVTRTGGKRGTVRVDYATAGGTALSNTDFTAASNYVEWANDDDADKPITVDITNDGDLEIDEEFTVTLSDPLNLSTPADAVTLGSPSVATVTIIDDEPDQLDPVLILDEPMDGADVEGVITVAGNAIDDCAVKIIKVLVDDILYDTVPNVPLEQSVDFSYGLPTWDLTNGDHVIKVIVVDYDDKESAEQTANVSVFNEVGILGANGLGGCVPGAGAGAGAGTLAMAVALLVGTLRRRR